MEPTLSSISSKPSTLGWQALFRHPFVRLLGFKLVYLALLINALLLFPTNQDANIFHSDRQAWTTDGHLTIESHFVAWDSEHYLHLSERGYQAGTEVCAFYPLWPMAVRYFSPLVGGSDVLGGMILANLVSLAGFYLFFRLVQRRFGDATAWLAAVLLLAFPGSLFYQFNYTEGLFFLLLMLLCTGLEEGITGLALVASFLLPLTRGVGIFCIFPLLLHVCLPNEGMRIFLMGLVGRQRWVPERVRKWVAMQFQDGTVKIAGYIEADSARPRAQQQEHENMPGKIRWLHNITNLPRPGTGAVRSGRPVTTPWLVVAPFFGWSVYLMLMWHWTGNPFEGFAAQRFWGVQSIGNLFDVPKFVVGFLTPTAWHEFSGSVLDRGAFLVCLYMLPVIWKLDKVWLVWALVLGWVPAMSGTFVSFTRFASVAFPVFIALAVLLAKRERWFLRYLTIGVFSVLHVVLLWRFVNYRWAG